MMNLDKNKPIGVFDSGIGGLTVLKAIQSRFPYDDYIYIGDTARLPYGTKSPETVIKYSQGIAQKLLEKDVKAIVVACSTASTQALEAVQSLAGNVPVIGMVEPSAQAAVKATRNGHIAVMATAGTTRNGAYPRALNALNPAGRVSAVACQMLVALAEEGWVEGDIPRSVLHRYLDSLFAGGKTGQDNPDTIILGCTHFPVFVPLLQEMLGSSITLINSGEAAAQSLTPYALSHRPCAPVTEFYVTDDPHRFAESAARFYDHRITPDAVKVIDVGT